MGSVFSKVTLGKLVGATLAWLFFCGLLLVAIWPMMRQSTLQLVAFIVLGPPLYALGEYVADRVLSPELGSRISVKRFSALRILVALGVAVLLVAIASTIIWSFGLLP